MRQKYFGRRKMNNEGEIIFILLTFIVIGAILQVLLFAIPFVCIYFFIKGIYDAITNTEKRTRSITIAAFTGVILILMGSSALKDNPNFVPPLPEEKAGDFKHVGHSLDFSNSLKSDWLVALRFADGIYEIETDKPTDTHWSTKGSRIRFTINETGKFKNFKVLEKYCSANLVNCYYDTPNAFGFDEKKWVYDLISNIVFDKYSDLQGAEIIYKLQSRKESTVAAAIQNDIKRVNELINK